MLPPPLEAEVAPPAGKRRRRRMKRRRRSRCAGGDDCLGLGSCPEPEHLFVLAVGGGGGSAFCAACCDAILEAYPCVGLVSAGSSATAAASVKAAPTDAWGRGLPT